MTKTVYNIVWADDEIDGILDKEKIEELKSNGFNIVGTAHDGKELESILEKPEMIDAVIVDANFNESGIDISNERDTSGLDFARSLYLHTLKKNIPFFLFTNRPDEELRNNYQNNPNFLKDFPRNKRWFKKSTEENKMFEEIRKAVDDANTPEFKMRNKYANEFDAATLVPGAKTLLLQSLLFEFSEELSDEIISNSFNSLRMIFEKIIDVCVRKNLLPKLSSLNSYVDLFEMRNVEGFKLNVQVMPTTLCRSLDYFLDITQDGSHDNTSLSLGVNEYVRKTKNNNLYKSVLFVLLDLLLWNKKFNETALDIESIWSGTYEAEGTVCVQMNGSKPVYLVNGEYQIQNNGNLKEGDLVSIIKSCPNKHPFGTFTKFVFKTNYIIKNNLSVQKDCTKSK